MLRLLHIIAATLLVSICIAQTGNPFDIPERLSSVEAVVVDSIAVEDEVLQENAVGIDAISDVVPEQEVTDAMPAYQSVITGDNPFNVDHVPIRRRSLEKADTSSVIQRHETLGHSVASRSTLFVFLVEIISLIFIGLVLNTQRGFLSKLWRSLTNENILKLNHRDHNSSRDPVYLLMYLVFMANLAAFAFLIVNREYVGSGAKLWAYILAGLIAVYFCKHLFLAGVSLFLPLKKEAQLYSFTIITYNIAIGISLIPINMMMAFGPSAFFEPMMYVGIFLIISTLLLRYLRGLTISLPHLGTNPFHFLLYICTTEIAPVLILFRIISKL